MGNEIAVKVRTVAGQRDRHGDQPRPHPTDYELGAAAIISGVTQVEPVKSADGSGHLTMQDEIKPAPLQRSIPPLITEQEVNAMLLAHNAAAVL